MFLERKILGRLHGEAHRHLDATVGLGSLRDSIAQFPAGSPATKLVVDLKETNPDDVFSTVPYEKGHTLLAYLEELVGGPSVFEPYLAAHVKQFAGKSIDTQDWKEYLIKFFAANQVASQKLASVDWDAWFYGLGMPPTIPKYDATLVKPCKELADSVISGQKSGTKVDYFGLSTQQQLVWLDILIDNKDKLTTQVLHNIDSEYKISSSKNVEICLKWYILSLSLKDSMVFDKVCQYVIAHGRMKYNRPLYRLLAACSEEGRALAVKTFSTHRAFYHPIAAQMIAKDLGL